MRTWADTARYMYEGIKDKGYGLAMMMELVFEDWDVDRKRANFKAEDFIHKNSAKSLADAARATAKRMNLDPTATEALVQQICGLLPRALRPRSETGSAFPLDSTAGMTTP